MKSSILKWLAATLMGLLVLGGTANAQEVPAYKLGSGDKLRVTVFGDEDLSGEFDVDGAGNFSMPLIGKVVSGGMTIDQAEDEVERLLLDGYLVNPRVSIEVLNYRPFYILGEVNNPGSYAFVSGMTVLNAVALAGGYTYRAREENVRINRATDPEKQEVPVSITEVVLPGDIIRVPERHF